MGVSADMNLPELLVLIAEAAIFQGDFDTASQSVEWFFSECQLKNQIARQLMKQSTFQFLVPSLTNTIEALKLTGETDVAWLFRLQLALVYAQMDANQLANAAKTINDVVDVQITPRLTDPTKAGDGSFKALYEEALRIQVHVGSFKDAECQKIVPNVKRLIPPTNKRASLLVKLQCVKSGNVSGTLEAAYTEIFQEATGLLAFSPETPVADVKSFANSLELKVLEAIDAEVLVEIAIHAAFNNSLPIAEACDVILQKKGKSMPPKTRVLHQVLSAIFLVVKPSIHGGNKTNSRQRQSMLLARRVEAIKAFERTLLAGKRQQDPQLIERICIYAWNLSLPLLQPHLRSHLARVFGLSSSILEELESLLLGFRARLYLEVAKLEVTSDFLAKANANVSKALTLDYGIITRPNDAQPVTIETLSVNEDWVTRPVDTQLLPIKNQLDLKLSSANETSKSTEVLAMLEQVKEGKDLKQQGSILARCVELMTELSDAVESPASAADNVRLWSEISTLAWNALHDGDLAQEVAERVLATYFSTPETGNATILQSISSEKSLKILENQLGRLEVLPWICLTRSGFFQNAQVRLKPSTQFWKLCQVELTTTS
ncbi:hypothetical protein BBO99_00006212 [Phytophthora kernoviae]|uniref:Uncharacterized protein n=2 Tax=Phytophthora kernoviae TaxID=325452 RepID=A0A3R7JSF1_9STRA|nr:hypothetical protein G195_007119 [Phytophthora kernoviae 00238/432]KAG2520230.1 hypothetical protein JM16_006851 [Phytophthora kernoviae]RLN06883.1 hypothetical protein BBI17_006303 [Phytophthora kernoviae]RLN78100.1 hypothetical protein BBO99_00006212 [Phytophthora kernoviae]